MLLRPRKKVEALSKVQQIEQIQKKAMERFRETYMETKAIASYHGFPPIDAMALDSM